MILNVFTFTFCLILYWQTFTNIHFSRLNRWANVFFFFLYRLYDSLQPVVSLFKLHILFQRKKDFIVDTKWNVVESLYKISWICDFISKFMWMKSLGEQQSNKKEKRKKMTATDDTCYCNNACVKKKPKRCGSFVA